MRRLLILTACIVLGGTPTASASNVSWIAAARSTYDDTWDEIDYRLVPPGFPSGVKIVSLEGTWTALSGASMNLTGTDAQWKGRTDNGYGPDGSQSYVNLDTLVSAGFSRLSGGSGYTSFTGTWLSTGSPWLSPVDSAPGDGFDETLLASIFVTHGGNVSYSGQFGFSDPSGNSSTQAGSFSSVPEPGMLLLSGIAGLALLAFRCWGRRRARAVA